MLRMLLIEVVLSLREFLRMMKKLATLYLSILGRGSSWNSTLSEAKFRAVYQQIMLQNFKQKTCCFWYKPCFDNFLVPETVHQVGALCSIIKAFLIKCTNYPDFDFHCQRYFTRHEGIYWFSKGCPHRDSLRNVLKKIPVERCLKNDPLRQRRSYATILREFYGQVDEATFSLTHISLYSQYSCCYGKSYFSINLRSDESQL